MQSLQEDVCLETSDQHQWSPLSFDEVLQELTDLIGFISRTEAVYAITNAKLIAKVVTIKHLVDEWRVQDD